MKKLRIERPTPWQNALFPESSRTQALAPVAEKIAATPTAIALFNPPAARAKAPLAIADDELATTIPATLDPPRVFRLLVGKWLSFRIIITPIAIEINDFQKSVKNLLSTPCEATPAT